MNIVETFVEKEVCDMFATPSGERYHEQFVGKLDKETGEVVLVSVGKVDQFQEIQSYEGETDINTLITRAVNGDLSAFKSAVFGDFTDMPETYADALNIVIEAEREFNHLPQEIRDKFDNNWHKYISLAGTEQWFKNFTKEEVKKEEEVKEHEPEQ